MTFFCFVSSFYFFPCLAMFFCILHIMLSRLNKSVLIIILNCTTRHTQIPCFMLLSPFHLCHFSIALLPRLSIEQQFMLMPLSLFCCLFPFFNFVLLSYLTCFISFAMQMCTKIDQLST